MVLRNNIVLTVAGLASPKTSATIDAVAGRKSLGHMTLLGLGVFIQRVRPKPNVELFIKKSKLSKLSLWKVRRLSSVRDQPFIYRLGRWRIIEHFGRI